MRLLFAGMKHDYGRREQGLSFEYYNFVEPLREMADEVILLDTGRVLQGMRPAEMGKALVKAVKDYRPDGVVTLLFKDELPPETLDDVRVKAGVPTVNWFADDHWRFEDFTRRYAPHFDWVVTTARSALPKYKELGVARVIKSQWACNPFRYRPVPGGNPRDVAFVGQPHGNRRAVIGALGQRGISVETWGQGWPNGRIGQDEMIRLFSSARVNLNLSNSSVSASDSKLMRRTVNRIAALPLPKVIRDQGRRLLEGLRALRPAPVDGRAQGYSQQIKGRDFEIPACGGFMLTEAAEDLSSYYQPGKEVVCYDGFEDLVGKIQHYLAADDERQSIATAGYRRTVAEHTWFHRFEEIFTRMGLNPPRAREILQRGSRPGTLTEVFP